MQSILLSLLFSILPIVLSGTRAETEADAHDAETEEHTEAEEGHELHAANAVLFLFTALVFGIVLRRAMSGFIIPYTGLLVVRLVLVLCNTIHH